MGTQEELEKKAFWRLVRWITGLLVGITGLNILFILNAVGTPIFKPIQRNLALAEQPETIEAFNEPPPLIEVNCLKKNKKISIRTKALNTRLVFQHCKEITEILNETNKNQGSLFSIGKNKWTSDYISLKEGLNKIQATTDKHTQVIEITREVYKKSETPKAL